ncbi:MAG: proprotein convertase P-domain-containing protein [Planctomycetes bacterium]|nr:proprotein convertase P-domain-containing protein [Planctomycetota bacterium]
MRRTGLFSRPLVITVSLVLVLGAANGSPAANIASAEAPGRPDSRPTPRKQPAVLAAARAPLAAAATCPEIRLPEVDGARLLAEDDADPDSQKRLRVGVSQALAITAGDGAWTAPGNGDEEWGAVIVSEGAVGLRLHFTDVRLPPGTSLWVWAEGAVDGAEGPISGMGPLGSGEFWTGILAGDAVRVVYRASDPDARSVPLPFTIAEAVHVYRDFLAEPAPLAAADPCHNDTTCYPAWADVRNSVARIVFVENGSGYLCTGQLLDAQNGDLTPYFLTANHCISSQPVAETTVAYWFYQTDVCDGPAPTLNSRPISRFADLVSTGDLSVSSDYSLLMIRGTLPVGVYWSGWTAGTVPFGTPSACIHHPLGNYKRISFGTRGQPVGDFWQVVWTDGPTEPGSSGSGVWRADTQQLYGQLSGGPSTCTNVTYDEFGMFATAYGDIAGHLTAGPDDSLEENDTCAEATPLAPGFIPGQVVKIGDDDWYEVAAPPCADLTIGLSFRHAFGDVDLEVYDACGGSLVAASTGVDDGESVTIPSEPGERTFRVRAYLATNTRNTYGIVAVLSGVGGGSSVDHFVGTSGLPATIPDNNPTGVSRSLSIPSSGTVLDLNLDLLITHTWNGDLSIELSHGGVTARVIDRPGSPSFGLEGFDDDGFGITLDDSAVLNIETYTSAGPQVRGTFTPSPQSLSAFNGMDRAGTWTLRVWDQAGQDSGSLVEWGLWITTPAAAACTRGDAAGDVCAVVDQPVDLIDVAYFQTCFTDATNAPVGSCCSPFDFDGSGHVDLPDVDGFIQRLSGP